MPKKVRDQTDMKTLINGVVSDSVRVYVLLCLAYQSFDEAYLVLSRHVLHIP